MNFTILTVEILIPMSRSGLLPGFLFPGGVSKNDLFEVEVISLLLLHSGKQTESLFVFGFLETF